MLRVAWLVVLCPCLLAGCVSTGPLDAAEPLVASGPATAERLTPICDGNTPAPAGFPSQVFVRNDRDQVLVAPLYRVDKADITGAVGAPTRAFTVGDMEFLLEVRGDHVELHGSQRGEGDPITCTYLPPRMLDAYVRDHSL